MANNDQQLNSNRANNEQVPLEPQGQLQIEEQNPTGSGHNSVPRVEFDQRNARKQIPNDVNESDEEDHRNDINSGALNLEKMIKMLVSQQGEILKILKTSARRLEKDGVAGFGMGTEVENNPEDSFKIDFLKCMKEILARMD
ncbi:hypothetical protein HAX54_050494 [Datura stramonium]|uniref:Uncharacterized protein n=1 Tax=Datura stramonium TaxID=4076 RepID=A0ABS8WQD1_DATST|nr:hypothetical protein [Datura stramonium]